MTFTSRFESTDEFLSHTDEVITDVTDTGIQATYAGFIAISAVTAYELAIRDVIFRFSDQKHSLLGSVSRNLYRRLNGRISLRDLRKQHVGRFGESYLCHFNRLLDEREVDILAIKKKSVQGSYSNVIQWRNKFAHEGQVPPTTNYEEVKHSYELGKEVIFCLDKALRN